MDAAGQVFFVVTCVSINKYKYLYWVHDTIVVLFLNIKTQEEFFLPAGRDDVSADAGTASGHIDDTRMEFKKRLYSLCEMWSQCNTKKKKKKRKEYKGNEHFTRDGTRHAEVYRRSPFSLSIRRCIHHTALRTRSFASNPFHSRWIN